MLATLGFAEIVLIVVVYFWPTLVAVSRKKENQNAIAWVNLLLGWTGITWLMLLIVAYAPEKQKPPVS